MPLLCLSLDILFAAKENLWDQGTLGFKDLIMIILQEKLKGSLPLAAIDSVEVSTSDDGKPLLKIAGPYKHLFLLVVLSKKECKEWQEAISRGE